MAANTEVTSWLDERHAQYEVLPHDKVFDSVGEARLLGIDVDEIAKSLVVHVTHQGSQAILVVPGGQRVNKQKICDLFGTHHARLALESELIQDFPQFELGAIPPLGGLLHLPVYIDRRLVNHETVLFNAGTHTASIKMSMHDFINFGEAAIVDVVDEREAA